jgi:multidrug efflux system outer membrane protein
MKTMTLKPLALACLGALALSLAGCAHIPSESAPPLAQRDLAGAELSAGIKLARDGWPEARWWTVYGDPQLDALISAALAASPTLDAAAARIGSAHSALARTRADAGLDTGLAAGVTRQRYSATGLFPAPIGGSTFTDETLRLEARYDFDWWGRNKAQIASAIGEVNARQAEYAAAERALAAAIAQHYFTLQGGWIRRANLQQLISTQQALLDDAAQRIARGLASSDEQRQADGELALLRKQLAQLAGDNAHEREALRALLDSSTLVERLQPRPLPAGPHSLPSRLSMELLARRPDLQAARWRVEASLSRIDAAKAAFYPDINISGALGLNTISIDRLLQSPSRTFQVGPSLTLPLFDSKRLAAQLEGTRAERNAIVADYNQAVVDAVRDVAQDAALLQAMESQIGEQAFAAASAQALLQSAQDRMVQGLANQHAVLAAQLTLLRQQEAMLYLQQAQLVAEVALIHTLGGGYRADNTAFTLKK